MNNAKKIIIKITSLFLFVVCMAFVVSDSTAYTTKVVAAKDSTVQGYEDRLSNLKKEQDRLKKEIAKAQANAATQKEQKDILDKEIKNLNDQILTINALITVCLDQIEEKEASITQKSRSLKKSSSSSRTECVYPTKRENWDILLCYSARKVYRTFSQDLKE